MATTSATRTRTGSSRHDRRSFSGSWVLMVPGATPSVRSSVPAGSTCRSVIARLRLGRLLDVDRLGLEGRITLGIAGDVERRFLAVAVVTGPIGGGIEIGLDLGGRLRLEGGELVFVEPPLPDPGLLPAQVAQVVQLRAPHAPALDDLDLRDRGGVQRERPLDTDPERDLAHRERL